jgi:multidrug efflux pump subunit AcrA (membrane-fusion protein)
VKVGEASLQNLQVQKNFQKIIAPFTGTVTNRFIDIGSLVSAGGGIPTASIPSPSLSASAPSSTGPTGSPTGATAGVSLFSLQQTDPLRIFVFVPQSNAPSIEDGMEAMVLVQEYPGQNFKGTVVRTAGAIDPASRTLMTEVDIPNPDGKLFAGMYGLVKFQLKDKNPPIILPANAFTFRTAGPQVAMVTKDNRIHWQSVGVGRDFGTELEVTSGLEENDAVVVNPTDDLTEGLSVQVKASAPPPGAAR